MGARVALAEGRCLWAENDLPAAKAKMHSAVVEMEATMGPLHPEVAGVLQAAPSKGGVCDRIVSASTCDCQLVASGLCPVAVVWLQAWGAAV
jgi:hypothetical protein